MPTPDHLADDIIAAAAENTKPLAAEETAEEQTAPVGDFRHNLLRFADLADAAVRETRQLRAEIAMMHARHEQEVKAHMRTSEMLKAAERTAIELREQIIDARENNARLRAHIEAQGNNLLSAIRLPGATILTESKPG